MRIRLASWLCGVVAGCVVLAAVPEAASAQAKVNTAPHEATELTKLVLRGVQQVDIVDLENNIATQATSCRNILVTLFCLVWRSPLFVDRQYLDRGKLARDIIGIRVYYWRRGYRATEVDTIVTPTGPHAVTVTFDIKEDQPTLLRRLTIDYDPKMFTEQRVKKLTILNTGEPLDLVKLDSMRLLFANEMWSKGHSDATVDTTVTVDKERRVGDVHLTLIPNHATFVGPIEVIGLDKVSKATVLNAITLRTGDPYRAGDVLESQRNLFESNLFRLAAVEVPPQFDSVKRIAITVSESPLHDAHTAFGLTNIDFLQVDGTYTAYNLLGGGRRLDISTTVGNLFAQQLAGHGFFYNPGNDIPGADSAKFLQPTWAASVDFRQPAFLHRPANQAGFSAFTHRRSTPGIFIDRGYGGAVTLTNQVRIRAPASLTYRFEMNRVEASDVYFCIDFGVCDTTRIAGLRSHQRLSPVSLTGFVDRSDDPLDPTRGYLAHVDIEHASRVTLSDYAYNRAYVDIAAYDHRGLNSVYAAHLRLGIVRSIGGSALHPRKQLYAGGASSVRGYGTNQLGPRVLTIDPNKLTDTSRTGHCTLATVADGSCDVNAISGLADKEFNPQPLGGTSLLEGSIEYRFPIALRRKLTAAVFIDGAVVGSGPLPTLQNFTNITRGTGAITPGFGFRYKSPVGPIRVDIGFSPARVEQLPVVTEVTVNGERKIVPLSHTRSYSPAVTLLDRFTLHFSIGQAY
jgi:outer membrane protein insertion porin family